MQKIQTKQRPPIFRHGSFSKEDRRLKFSSASLHDKSAEAELPMSFKPKSQAHGFNIEKF